MHAKTLRIFCYLVALFSKGRGKNHTYNYRVRLSGHLVNKYILQYGGRLLNTAEEMVSKDKPMYGKSRLRE